MNIDLGKWVNKFIWLKRGGRTSMVKAFKRVRLGMTSSFNFAFFPIFILSLFEYFHLRLKQSITSFKETSYRMLLGIERYSL